MKKNKTWRFTKTLKCVMKEETWRRLRQKTSTKFSSALNVRRLLRSTKIASKH